MPYEVCGDHRDPDSGTARRRMLLLCGIILLGAALRLYRIGDQSIWLDEWPNVAHLQAENVWRYILLFRMTLPEQAHCPLFYVILYYWAALFGDGFIVLRLLPVLLGLTAIPMAYLLTRYAFGWRAGLIAAFCLALSPQHIWHAQEIRMYSMLTPAVALSMYALLRALEEGRQRWWLLHLLINALLVWIHAFAILVPVAQGVFLLITRRRRLRLLAEWGGAHLLIYLPWIWWLNQMPYSYTSEFTDVFTTGGRVIRDMFFDDVAAYHSDLLPAWKTNLLSSLPVMTQRLLRPAFLLNPMLAALTFLGVIRLAAAAAVSLWRRWRRHEPVSRRGDAAVLLSILLVLPVAVLGVASLILRQPYLSPMYSMYNTLAIYAGMGIFIAGIRKNMLKHAALILLAGLYAYQLVLVLPETTRADWRGAARYLEAKSAPDDLILHQELVWPGDYLPYYLDASHPEIRCITTFHGGCQMAREYLEKHPGGTVWLLFESAFLSWFFPEYNLQDVLADGLRDRGLVWEYMRFQGHYNIDLYRITPEKAGIRTEKAAPVPDFNTIDYAGLTALPGLYFKDEKARAAAEEAFRRHVAWWPPMFKLHPVIYAMDLLEEGHPELAGALARAATAQYPEYSLGWFMLGLCLAARNGQDEAEKMFEKAYGLDPGLSSLAGAYTAALFSKPDEVGEELVRFKKERFLLYPAVKAVEEIRRGPGPNL